MKKSKHFTKCPICSKTKKRNKSIAYGSKRSKSWCKTCDKAMVDGVNKKSVRQKSKKEIKNELHNA